MQKKLLAFLFSFSASFFVDAKEKLPLWEVGIGGVAFNSPDYPGSDENQTLLLPFPYVIYRGDFLRAGREGVKGVFFENENTELNISLGGNLPTDDDNEARLGMPELDPLIEIGPSFQYRFFNQGHNSIYLRLPLRSAFSVFGEDDVIKYRGLVLNPEVKSSHKLRLKDLEIDAEFNVGPLFVFDGINDYFYGVESVYATAKRPFYEAESGYMGTELSADFDFSLTPNIRIFTSFELLVLNGAENENSPLFRDSNNTSLTIGFIYTFFRSD